MDITGYANGATAGPSKALSNELRRLITAAVVSPDFCHLLLTDPEQALTAGYNGRVFILTHEKRRAILSIRANTLAEFARQLAEGQESAELERTSPPIPDFVPIKRHHST